MLAAFATQGSGQELPGLSGWIADVIASMGEVGVALLVALENLVPPIPSEVVLPFAGFLARQGRLSLVGAIVAATIGSAVGAQVLYELGRKMGIDRLKRITGKVPLVDADDVEKGVDWFDRHGRSAIFTGRLLPGIRSLVSIPAGAREMPRLQFQAYTVLGSGIWNVALVMAGWWLGDSWQRAETVATWVNYGLIIAMVLLVARFAWNKWRAGRHAEA